MAEGGYENLKDDFDTYGFNKDGYDKDGNDRDGYDEEGYKNGYNKFGYGKDGYDKDGYNTYGHDKDGNLFVKEKGEEHFPLLTRPRTSTSNVRETQRPFKPRVRTSTRKGVSFENPSFHLGDDEMETSFGGIREGIPNVDEHNYELREQVKKYYPDMDDAAIVVGQNKKGYLSVRLFGSNDRWSPVVDFKGKLFIQFSKDLKKALGFDREKIIKLNNEDNFDDQVRIEELEKALDREDISEEVKNTTINEIKGLKKMIVEREKENEALQNLINWKERIKEIFKKYGFTIGSVVTAVGVVIGVIVSKLTAGLSSMAKSVASGLKDIGGKLAQILPGMIGAIASFIFKTAGQVFGFLAENAWILVVAVVVYFVESLKKKRTR